MYLNPHDLATALLAATLASAFAARRTGARSWAYLALGLQTMILAYGLLGYRTRWDFGPRYGMPMALVAADGTHYRDGTRIDPFTLSRIRDGNEGEVFLGLQVVAGTLLAGLGGMLYRAYRKEIDQIKHQVLAALMREAAAKGDRPKTDFLRDRHAGAAVTGITTRSAPPRLPDADADPADARRGGAATA